MVSVCKYDKHRYKLTLEPLLLFSFLTVLRNVCWDVSFSSKISKQFSCQPEIKSNLHQNISELNEAFWLTYYYIRSTNLNYFMLKQLTLAPTKMFRLPWLNEKNCPFGCFPIHLSKTCALHFLQIENKQNMP